MNKNLNEVFLYSNISNITKLNNEVERLIEENRKLKEEIEEIKKYLCEYHKYMEHVLSEVVK